MERLKIHERIGILRAKQGMSGEEFAAALGLEGKNRRSTINNWESGANNVKADDIERICKRFNVSADWLLGLAPENNYTNDQTVKLISDYTGLSTEAVLNLHNMDQNYRDALMPIFESNTLDTVGGYLWFAIWSIQKADRTKFSPWIVIESEEKRFNDDGTITTISPPKESARHFLTNAINSMKNIIETAVVSKWNEIER